MATNDITGDSIATRFGSKEAQEKFDASFEQIFGQKKKTNGGWTPPPLYSEDWQSEERATAIAQNGNTGEHYDATSKPTK
jgi:hypothetical protein